MLRKIRLMHDKHSLFQESRLRNSIPPNYYNFNELKLPNKDQSNINNQKF